jgi:hypothetical protein
MVQENSNRTITLSQPGLKGQAEKTRDRTNFHIDFPLDILQGGLWGERYKPKKKLGLHDDIRLETKLMLQYGRAGVAPDFQGIGKEAQGNASRTRR